MSIKELTTILPPLVLLALILSITPELCQPTQTRQVFITENNQFFDPFCYVKSLSPEPPELKVPKPIGGMQNISSIMYLGTAASGTSQYYSASPSFDNPEDS
jgi:hypothetical protein